MTQFDQKIDSESIQVNAQGNVQKVDLAIDPGLDAGTEDVPSSELNAWRRGITPQAEIWNGRLAMLGLSVGIGVLLLVRIASH
jgi:hypothetical protein